jgi:two-component system OmpR family response regulator
MKALIVEDNREEAGFVSASLAAKGFCCRRVASGEAGLQELSADSFDIAIVDVVLGDGMSGIELIRQMRKGKINTPVIVLSGRNQPADKIEGLNCGADDYIGKPFARGELLARVDAVLRRSSGMKSDRTLRVKDLSVRTDTHEVRRGERPVNLTTGEYELLEFLMTNTGRTLSTKVILQRVWNVDSLPPSKIVESRICSLRRKLSQNGEPDMISTIRGFGYVLR